MRLGLAAVLLIAGISIGRAADPALGARLGTSIGSPIPFGNIPEGASGSPVMGIVAGGWVDWFHNDTWSVVSEVQWVHYASMFSTPLTDHPVIERVMVSAPDGTTVTYDVETVFTGTTTGAFSNDYVQVPVYAAWKPLEQWRFTGGGYLGWLVATRSFANGVGQVGIRPEVVEKDMHFDEQINGLDYGIQAGIQYLAFQDLSFDARAALGLTSVFDEEFRTVDRTVQNFYVHVSVAYRIL